MEQKQLPNSTAVLVLGILSLPLCLCYGIGIVTAIIAVILAYSATKTYKQNPELYTGYSNVKTGRILAIISIILHVLMFAFVAWIISIIGLEVFTSGDQQAIEEAINDYFGV